MNHLVEFISALMDLGSHGHIYFSGLQLITWYKLLIRAVKEVVKHERVLESEQPITKTKPGLEV